MRAGSGPGTRRRTPPRSPTRLPPSPGPHPGQFLGAAHKPGAIPLRPLNLGDIYDAALKIIRFNPKATVGSAVLVTAVAMAIPVVLTAFLTFALDLSLDPEATDYTATETAGLVGSFGSLLLGIFLQSIGLVLVTGMIAHVVAAAAIGQRLGLGEAWARTRGKRWRLIGLTLLLLVMSMLLLVAYGALWIPVIALGDVLSVVVFGGGDGPALPRPDVLVLDPRLLPPGAGADARAGRRDRSDRPGLPADQPVVLAHLRDRAADVAARPGGGDRPGAAVHDRRPGRRRPWGPPRATACSSWW